MTATIVRAGSANRVLVIGAGIAGLVAALEASFNGFEVIVLEKEAQPGGKLRQLEVGGRMIDAGPTVLTMRWVFDDIFDSVGLRLDDHLRLTPLDLLARHAWNENERLDLYSDRARSIDAIGRFAGASEARGYEAFCRTAAALTKVLRPTFMAAEKPTMLGLAARMASADPASLFLVNPQASLWHTLERYFKDPRLLQLFGRYATYCGASPFSAPATLMLIAHVETEGVFAVAGGMAEIARTLARLCERRGATVRCGANVASLDIEAGRVAGVRLANGERIAAGAVVFNGDSQAIASGLLGEDARPAVDPLPRRLRSLSAMATTLTARFDGFPLDRHNVFFSSDYRAEFADILQRRQVPSEPTVYICAQDRGGPAGDAAASAEEAVERALVLVNAPADGDSQNFTQAEIDTCWENTTAILNRCGLRIAEHSRLTTTPADFHHLFPATGGALYGRASHGSLSAFQRPGCRTRIPGLYLAGGSVHPGPGVPMAALSGRQAAASLAKDRGSIRLSRPGGTSGGTSTR